MSLHNLVYNYTPKTISEAAKIARLCEEERASYENVWIRNESHYEYLVERAEFANERVLIF